MNQTQSNKVALSLASIVKVQTFEYNTGLQC